MQFDVLHPIQSENSSRIEILLVSFEGFIKNPSEGIIRTMLREYDRWIEEYSKLEMFDGMGTDDLYEATMLFSPLFLMKKICDGNKTEEEIYDDLDQIMPHILLENSRITQFEFALFQTLKTDNVKKCYIYKESYFFDNEINYLISQFKSVSSKIELIDQKSLPEIFKEVNPTTMFLTEPAFVFDYLKNHYDEEKLKKKMFIILNSVETVDISETGSALFYTDLYKKSVDESNNTKSYGVASMFNFALNTSVIDAGYDHSEEENDDEE